MIERIKQVLQQNGGDFKEKNKFTEYKTVIAERKAFLTSQKVEYIAKFKIDEAAKKVEFSEMLAKKGAGMSSGDPDFGGAGFGFSAETYNTTSGAREGGIQQQADLFGKKFDFNFEWNAIRPEIEKIAQENGYQFEYLGRFLSPPD